LSNGGPRPGLASASSSNQARSSPPSQSEERKTRRRQARKPVGSRRARGAARRLPRQRPSGRRQRCCERHRCDVLARRRVARSDRTLRAAAVGARHLERIHQDLERGPADRKATRDRARTSPGIRSIRSSSSAARATSRGCAGGAPWRNSPRCSGWPTSSRSSRSATAPGSTTVGRSRARRSASPYAKMRGGNIVDGNLRWSSEQLTEAAHQLPERRVPEVVVLGIHVRPLLHQNEGIRRLDVLADAVALTAFLGTGLGGVHANELQPAIALFGLDRDLTTCTTIRFLPISIERSARRATRRSVSSTARLRSTRRASRVGVQVLLRSPRDQQHPRDASGFPRWTTHSRPSAHKQPACGSRFPRQPALSTGLLALVPSRRLAHRGGDARSCACMDLWCVA